MCAGALAVALAWAWTSGNVFAQTAGHADAKAPVAEHSAAAKPAAPPPPVPAAVAPTAESGTHAPALSIPEATDLLRAIEAQAAPAPASTAPAPDAAAPRSGTDRVNELVSNALSYIGVRYRYGGNTPERGFDCSGLVRWVYNRTWGVMLPRRASEIASVGTNIPKDQLKPGDLVFFNTLRRTFSHVGIYLGDGQFLHAPRSGGKVRVEKLDEAYWAKRWNGARRLDDAAPAVAADAAPPASLIDAKAATPKLH